MYWRPFQRECLAKPLARVASSFDLSEAQIAMRAHLVAIVIAYTAAGACSTAPRAWTTLLVDRLTPVGTSAIREFAAMRRLSIMGRGVHGTQRMSTAGDTTGTFHCTGISFVSATARRRPANAGRTLRWQHIKGNAFAVPLRSKSRASRKPWGIVIADHAAVVRRTLARPRSLSLESGVEESERRSGWQRR